MHESLLELVNSQGISMRVDAAAGVVRGVKILGLQSRNGRSYLPDALERAIPLYEGARVNVNHPAGPPTAPRDYRDRIGAIRGVCLRPGEGLFGDFHFNPKHALAEQLVWDAVHAPENVGFSHNVEAKTSRQGDQVMVEAILRVQSVDLVADPATTRGLFEGAAESITPPIAKPPVEEAAASAAESQLSLPTEPAASPHSGECGYGAEALAGVSLDELRRQRPDLVEAILEEQAPELRRLQADNERLTALEAARLAAAGKPQSREQTQPKPVEAPRSARDFVRAIT